MRIFFVPAVATALVMLIFSFSSAQTPGNPGPAGGDREITPERFKELKTDILKRIDERTKRIEEEKTCVTAATNMEELRKCRPERPARSGGQGEQGGQRRPSPFGQQR
jgi:hypothetical protein